MNIRKFFFSHQSAPAAEPVDEQPADVIVREDFTIENAANMTLRDLLNTLRQRTIRFSHINDLTWAATDFDLRGASIRVKLTENQDIVYFVNGELMLDLQSAIRTLKDAVVTF